MRKNLVRYATAWAVTICTLFAFSACGGGNEGTDNPGGNTPKATISLDQSKLQLVEGDNFTLRAKVSPEGTAVEWSSSDTETATVEQGTVNALKPGKATITAQAGTATAKCVVTVIAADKVVPITGIALSPAKVSINIGETTTLKIKFLPDNATAKEPTKVWWESDDDSVAEVSDGVVKGIGAGKTTVTVSMYGLLEDKQKPLTAECEVEVKHVPSGSDVLTFTDKYLLQHLVQQEYRYGWFADWAYDNGFAAMKGAPIDANGDGKITRAEAETVTCIYGYAIDSQKTIDDLLNNFPNLRYYGVGDNGGTSFNADLSELTKLEVLYISNFEFTLPKAGNALRYLGTRFAKNIDLTSCTKLESLDLYDYKEFTRSVDASMCKSLKTVSAKDCTALSSLVLPQSVTSLNISGTALNSYNIASLPNLVLLNVENLKNKWDFSSLKKLRSLNCTDTGITSLSLGSTAIEELYVSDNRIGSLAPARFANLRVLYCQNCGLTSLDVSSNTKLVHLVCNANKIGSVNVSKCSQLELLSCIDCGLSVADVTSNTKLQALYLSGNSLTSINLSKNTALTELELSSNNLGESIDISACKQLIYCNLQSNSRLKTIYVWKGFSTDAGQFYKDSGAAWKEK